MSILANALGKKFQFKVVNGTGASKVLALTRANFNTLGLDVTQSGTSPFAVSAVAEHFHDKSEIVSAGYAVDAVLDDGTVDSTSSGLVCTAMNSKFTIRHFLEYIRQNSEVISEMIIQADDGSAFEETMTIARTNPLFKAGEDYLNLSEFKDVNQYDGTKIVIKDLDLLLNDETLMYLPVGSGRTLQITFKFKS